MNDNTQKHAHARDLEHPFLDRGLIADLVWELRAQKLVAILKLHLREQLGNHHLHTIRRHHGFPPGSVLKLMLVSQHVYHRGHKVLCELLNISGLCRSL